VFSAALLEKAAPGSRTCPAQRLWQTDAIDVFVGWFLDWFGLAGADLL